MLMNKFQYFRFTCYFCNEQFRKDYKLKLHLMMKHKNVPAHEMDKAKEVLIKVGATKERIVFIALYLDRLKMQNFLARNSNPFLL